MSLREDARTLLPRTERSLEAQSVRWLLYSAALFVPAVLLCDGAGLGRQLMLGGATAGFLVLAARRTSIDLAQIAIAIAVATAGELILSVVWGLYSYRFTELVPLYVPFGHGLFYLFAAESARQSWAIRNERKIVVGVFLGGSFIAVLGLFAYRDQWGLLWWIVAAALIARSTNRALVSICFIYTMLLEWLGTTLGNWQWAAIVPGVGLTSGNPPSGVGLLYVLLDLITIAIWIPRAARSRRLAARSAYVSSARGGAVFSPSGSPLPVGDGERG